MVDVVQHFRLLREAAAVQHYPSAAVEIRAVVLVHNTPTRIHMEPRPYLWEL
jgi:hypothetical protein